MKTIMFFLIALIMGTSVMSCSTDPIDEEIPVEGTVGEDGEVENDPEEEDGETN